VAQAPISRSWSHEAGNAWTATLIENSRIDGKVKQRHVAYLGTIKDCDIERLGSRAAFWSKAKTRLDELGDRLTRKERKAIEAALVTKVKPLTKAERKKHERRQAEWQEWAAVLSR